MLSPSRHRRRYEALERRDLLAGDVRVDFDDGELEVAGDHLDNQVVITQLSGDEFEVTGVNGTSINGVPDGTFMAMGVERIEVEARGGNDNIILDIVDPIAVDVEIELGNGNDTLLASVAMTGSLSVEGGAGDDIVDVTASSVDGSVEIELGNGNDQALITGDAPGIGPVMVSGKLEIEGGNDDDLVSLLDVEVQGETELETGRGDDTVEILGLSRFSGLGVELGEGEDFFQFGSGDDASGNPTSIMVAGDLQIEAGRGEKVLALFHATVAGQAEIEASRGSTDLTIAGSTEFQQDLEIELNSDLGSTINLGLDPFNAVASSQVSVGGDLKMETGRGEDEIHFANTEAQGESDVETGAASDTVSLVDSVFQQLDAELGRDDDLLDIMNVDVTSRADLEGGQGFDTFDAVEFTFDSLECSGFEAGTGLALC
jgi:hypothetical protein